MLEEGADRRHGYLARFARQSVLQWEAVPGREVRHYVRVLSRTLRKEAAKVKAVSGAGRSGGGRRLGSLEHGGRQEDKVQSELALEDSTSGALSKMQGGLKATENVLSKLQSHFMDFGKQVAAVAIGVNIGNMLGGLKELATSGVAAALDRTDRLRDLSNTVAGMSKIKSNLFAYDQQAQIVDATLTKISMRAKMVKSDLVEAFVAAGANTVKTKDQLLAMMDKAAQAARIMRKPVKDVVEGFLEIEKNTISANNPIIAMVKQANPIAQWRLALRMQ